VISEAFTAKAKRGTKWRRFAKKIYYPVDETAIELSTIELSATPVDG